ncbi:MAG: hypothetical protein FWD25_08815 [Clostridia bacterium]|nr:hypothetical protein [Clostridia bacterium]
MLAIAMLLFYLLAGCAIMRWQLPRKRPVVRIWLGCSLGVLLLMWLPALFAFAFTFGQEAHLYALGALGLLMLIALLARDRQPAARWNQEDTRIAVLWLCAALPLCVLGGYLQHTHVLRPVDGAYNVGQSTYGDLNLHLGIATSLRNAAFPPEYSILPGARLSYPFLVNTLSTSLLLFDLPLRWAIIVPGTLMMALVFTGYLLLARSALGPRRWLVGLAMALFFINGGLGFLYSFDMAGRDFTRVADIFSGFYKTPANQPELNLRWSNVIADLMLPQRTLLGGWTLLLPALYLLRSAIQTRRMRQFFLTAIFAAALPLVHTHSFLALGLCSAGWIICALIQQIRNRRAFLWWFLGSVLYLSAVVLTLLLLPELAFELVLEISPELVLAFPSAYVYYSLALIPIAFVVVMGILLYKEQSKEIIKPLLVGGALYLCFTLALALPQLLSFAFPQTLDSGYLRIQLNWVNNSGGRGMIDGYLWFWIKNVGPAFVLLLCALLDADRQRALLASGAFAIFVVAEIILFQPNEYDNNKLFYIWYMIGALLVADYVGLLWDRLKGLRGRWVLASAFVIVSLASGGLSIAREVISDYQLFTPDAVATAEFVERETSPDALFITGETHVNPVAALAGRRIVCGTDLYLFFHGLDYVEQRRDCLRFYADPAGNLDVLERYGVDYILLGDYERSDHRTAGQAAFDELFERVFSQGGYTVYSARRAAVFPTEPEPQATETMNETPEPTHTLPPAQGDSLDGAWPEQP